MGSETFLQFDRQHLAQLGREYMVCAQFNSRTGYAALRINHGDDAYKDIAIANWMGASPVYTRRMQKAMGFVGGTDVATIFKGLQLECGFTHQYFDVHFEVQDENTGRFWLESCGALLETEPRGEEAVKLMCHDIEDPTFNATAVATNPRARMTSVHRPPRVPADREPHCEWLVEINPEAEPLTEPDITLALSETKLASLGIQRRAGTEPGGIDRYDGPVFEQLQLEQLSHGALAHVCAELAVQVHLLINGLMLSVADRYGEEAALAVGGFQMTGTSWVMSHRLAQWLGCSDDGIEGILQVLEVHPAFQPREYWSLEVNRLDDRRATLTMSDCPALQEEHAHGWQALLQRGLDGGLEALVKGVDERASVLRSDDAPLTWEISIADKATALEEPLAVQVAKGTVLYQTRLQDHIQLLQT